jgi:hypothetical protein
MYVVSRNYVAVRECPKTTPHNWPATRIDSSWDGLADETEETRSLATGVAGSSTDFILVGSADEKLPPAKSWDGYSNGDPVIHKNDQQKWRQSRIAACLVIAFITVMILPKVFGCVFNATWTGVFLQILCPRLLSMDLSSPWDWTYFRFLPQSLLRASLQSLQLAFLFGASHRPILQSAQVQNPLPWPLFLLQMCRL